MMNLITLGIDTIDKDKFKKVKNRRGIVNKPFGGLWCSPEECNYGWKDFVKNEKYRLDYYLSKMVLLTLKKSSKIYKIEEIDDFFECASQYHRSSDTLEKLSMNDFENNNDYGIIVNSFDYLIDYEKLSEDYDALWITSSALAKLDDHYDKMERNSSHTSFNLNPLFGWDVETVLLFNLNCVESYA